MTIPFSNKKESELFAKSLYDFIGKENNKKMSAYMSSENVFILHHGNSFSSTEDNESELTKHSVKVEFEYSDIRLYNIEQFYVFLHNFIEQISSQMTRTIYKTIGESCDKIGNVIDAKQEKMSNAEAFLEMLRKVELSVDKYGKVIMPQIHLHPSQSETFVKELEAQDETYHQLVENIKKEKSEQAIKKEHERLLKFEGISYE